MQGVALYSTCLYLLFKYNLFNKILNVCQFIFSLFCFEISLKHDTVGLSDSNFPMLTWINNQLYLSLILMSFVLVVLFAWNYRCQRGNFFFCKHLFDGCILSRLRSRGRVGIFLRVQTGHAYQFYKLREWGCFFVFGLLSLGILFYTQNITKKLHMSKINNKILFFSKLEPKPLQAWNNCCCMEDW